MSENALDRLQEILVRIEQRIDNIDQRLEKLETVSTANSGHCKKMSNHIDFIHGVYNHIKAPLYYMAHLCNRYMLPSVTTENVRLEHIEHCDGE